MDLQKSQTTDWSLLKFQYEILGVTVDELVKENPDVPVGLLKLAIQEGNWKAGSLDTLVPVVQGTEEGDDLTRFVAATKAQLAGASLVKQRALFPAFAKCEAVLLSKIMQAVSTVDPTDDKAAVRLTNLVKSFQGLLANNAFLSMQMTSTDEVGKDSKFVVQIVQQVN